MADTTSTPCCAVHEGAQAIGACARCGDFVCPLCLDPVAELPRCCASCRAREGLARMAWERADGSAWRRFARTCRDVLARPTDTFERVQPGSPLSALAFAALVGAVLGVAESVLGCTITGAVLAMGLAPETTTAADALPTILALALLPAPALAILHVIATLAWALVHAACVAVLGGRASLRTSLWAVSYVQAANLAWAPLTLVGLLPFGELFVLGFAVLLAAWASLRLTQISRRFAELGTARAALAGSLPPLVASAALIAAALFP